MSNKKKLTKYGTLLSGYGLGVFLNQGINLILIPIFWRVLKPEDFGIIAITEIISLFLQPIYLFGCSETIQRFYYHWTDEERPHYLGWFFWFIFFFTLILTILLDVLGSFFSHHLIVSVPFHPLLRYTLWSAFLSNFINIPIAISRIQQQVRTYNFLYNGSFLTQVGIVLYLVKFQNLGALGYVQGFFIANVIWFFPILFLTFREVRALPDRKFMNIPLNYAAPISFAGIIEGFTATLDRYFLDKFLPLATTGFYDLAKKFGSLVNVINVVTKLVFVPYIYKINSLKKNAHHILGHLGLIYGVLMTVPVIAVCTLSPEVVHILDPSGVYQQIVPYIPYFAVSLYFFAIGTVTGRGMDLAGVTTWSFLIPLVGGIASLFVYFYSLPEYGVWGVLWSVLIGSFARNFINVVLAVIYFPRKLYLKGLIVSWILAFVVYGFLTQLQIDNLYFSIAAKLSILLILLAGLIKFILYPHFSEILNLSPLTKQEL
ncbi:MAG: lipopolysaccharide biosynthesis protein [Pseudobdellovibrio sp.]